MCPPIDPAQTQTPTPSQSGATAHAIPSSSSGQPGNIVGDWEEANKEHVAGQAKQDKAAVTSYTASCSFLR